MFLCFGSGALKTLISYRMVGWRQGTYNFDLHTHPFLPLIVDLLYPRVGYFPCYINFVNLEIVDDCNRILLKKVLINSTDS